MLNDTIIKALEEKGFKRWTKGAMDRLYINAETLGLKLDYYKTGNICYAEYRGEKISNRRGSEMRAAKTYIDIETGELKSGNWTLEQDARTIYEQTMEEVEAEAAAEEEAEDAENETKEDDTMKNLYESKAKIVESGSSRVFNSWHEQADVTKEDFLEGIRWLCDDPRPNGRLSRELGCVRRADAGFTAEQLAVYGAPNPVEGVGLHRLTRCYFSDGSFSGFMDENGKRWDSTPGRASINVDDRI